MFAAPDAHPCSWRGLSTYQSEGVVADQEYLTCTAPQLVHRHMQRLSGCPQHTSGTHGWSCCAPCFIRAKAMVLDELHVRCLVVHTAAMVVNRLVLVSQLSRLGPGATRLSPRPSVSASPLLHAQRAAVHPVSHSVLHGEGSPRGSPLRKCNDPVRAGGSRVSKQPYTRTVKKSQPLQDAQFCM